MSRPEPNTAFEGKPRSILGLLSHLETEPGPPVSGHTRNLALLARTNQIEQHLYPNASAPAASDDLWEPAAERLGPPDRVSARSAASNDPTASALVASARPPQVPVTGEMRLPEPIQARAEAARPEPMLERLSAVVRDLVHGPNGEHAVSLDVDPPELGCIRVEVRLHDGKVAVHFVADDQAVEAALRFNLAELRDAIASMGIVAEQVAVSNSSDHGPGREHTRDRDLTWVDAITIPDNTPPRQRRRPQGLVDLLI